MADQKNKLTTEIHSAAPPIIEDKLNSANKIQQYVNKQFSLQELLQMVESGEVKNEDKNKVIELLQDKVDGVAWFLDDQATSIEIFKEKLRRDKEKVKCMEDKYERMKNWFKFLVYRYCKGELAGKSKRLYISETKAVNDNIPPNKVPVEYKKIIVTFDGPTWKSISNIVSKELGGIPFLKIEEEIKKTEFKKFMEGKEEDPSMVIINHHLKWGEKLRSKNNGSNVNKSEKLSSGS